MKAEDKADFIDFADTSMRDLRRTAYLLCGDWGHAEDAVQTGLLKVYLRWAKLRCTGSVWSYARRAVLTSLTDEYRKSWRTRESRVAELPETTSPDQWDSVHDRQLLQQALAALTRRQRAVVILRYVDDLDLAETAFVLKCPPGTVASSASRALAFLRKYLTEQGVVRGAQKEFR